MAKRKTNKQKKNSSKILNFVAWFLAIVAISLGAFIAGYYIGFDDAKQEAVKKIKQNKQKQTELEKKLQKALKTAKQEDKKALKKRLKEVLKQDKKIYISASHELDDNTIIDKPKPLPPKNNYISHKPRLAIIIDDVATKSQVKAIKSLHIPITMSFLPPSKVRPNTPKLASKESFYMVHLPMEAQHFNAEEPFTLRVSDSQTAIYDRVKKIKELFPKVRYINNHTGSKFTSDETAMNNLISAFEINHITFIDSRTTAKTKAPEVSKNFHIRYMSRDVFLDHHMDKPYILKQIKQAIKIAKRRGSAIAIGHPHKNTLKALYESKKLFNDIELVQVNKL
jgi:polysaccharide deacetylase 2 family uncharacterized protein YibQ